MTHFNNEETEALSSSEAHSRSHGSCLYGSQDIKPGSPTSNFICSPGAMIRGGKK